MINAQIEKLISHEGRLAVGGTPEGYQPFVLADMARLEGDRLVYIARDASAATAMRNMLGFFAPDITTVYLPAWDCLPYDRLSPQVAVMSERMATLAQLPLLEGTPHILVTTISAAAQRMPPRHMLAGLSMPLKPGARSWRMGVTNLSRSTNCRTASACPHSFSATDFAASTLVFAG